MSSEEKNHDPASNGPEEQNPETAPEPIDEAQGSPEDPGSVGGSEVVEEPGETAETNAEDVAQDELREEPIIVEEEISAALEELEATRKERDEYLEALRRLKAEFENFRKRQERELAGVRETASEKLVVELLPVLDNLDRALESEGDIHGGVRATRDNFSEVLSREGLAVVASDGQHFDPNVHEAVMGQPSEEYEEGTILQTFERGYLLNGKAIRPAKVVVAR